MIFTVEKGGPKEYGLNLLVDAEEVFEIGDYPYGCEGSGHFYGTSLEPGKYQIVRVE